MYVQTIIQNIIRDDKFICRRAAVKSILSNSIKDVITNINTFKNQLEIEYSNTNKVRNADNIDIQFTSDFDKDNEWKIGETARCYITITFLPTSRLEDRYENPKTVFDTTEKYEFTIFVQNTEVGYGGNY